MQPQPGTFLICLGDSSLRTGAHACRAHAVPTQRTPHLGAQLPSDHNPVSALVPRRHPISNLSLTSYFSAQGLCFPANIFQRTNCIIFMVKRSCYGSLSGVGSKCSGLAITPLGRVAKEMGHLAIIP